MTARYGSIHGLWYRTGFASLFDLFEAAAFKLLEQLEGFDGVRRELVVVV